MIDIKKMADEADVIADRDTFTKCSEDIDVYNLNPSKGVTVFSK